MLQALAYACYAGGYVAWTKPVRPRPLLLAPGLTTGIAVSFIALGVVGLALSFPSVGALVDYFSGQGDIFDLQRRPPWARRQGSSCARSWHMA